MLSLVPHVPSDCYLSSTVYGEWQEVDEENSGVQVLNYISRNDLHRVMTEIKLSAGDENH